MLQDYTVMHTMLASLKKDDKGCKKSTCLDERSFLFSLKLSHEHVEKNI